MDKVVTERSRLRDAGKGPAVVFIRDGGAPSKAGELLTESFRVLTVEPGSLDAVRGIGIGQFCLVAHGRAANEALAFAAAEAQSVEALVLLAPPPLESAPGGLAELQCPVMIFLGTKDRISPPTIGSAYKKALPKSYLTFVYDAGAEMDNERPEAVAAGLRQFLSERERFLVSKQNGMLYP